jgi:hypothetical protein
MLVDVTFRDPPPHLATMLGIIGGGYVTPERIGEGMYLCGHWSIDQLGVKVRERWREPRSEWLDFEEYGVCDTPEQAIEHLKLKERSEKFFVSFVKIERATQPRDGGWRWHKWGEYIGTKEPQCEYIHDEPEIESVYTFHVYEPKE